MAYSQTNMPLQTTGSLGMHPSASQGGRRPSTSGTLPYYMQAPQQAPQYPGPQYSTQTNSPPTPPDFNVGPPHPSQVEQTPLGLRPPTYSPRKDVTWTEEQIHLRIMLLGILACCCAAILPVLGAVVMLWDENYIFWEGYSFPIKVILLSAGVVLLLSIVCACLHKKAPRGQINEHTMAVVVALFSALLGVCLVLLALPSSRSLYNTAGRIAAGCHNSLPDSTLLVDYNQVLYNLRKTSACATMESIEKCAGWKENRYTSYIRYLEKEFHCGPLCPNIAPPGAAPPSAQLALLAEEAPRHAQRSSAAGTKTRKQLQLRASNMDHGDSQNFTAPSLLEQRQVPMEAPAAGKLFSFGTTRMECFPLVATRLRVLAWHNNDLTFWEGFGLICVSVLTSMVAFLSICCGAGDTSLRSKKQRRMVS